MKTPLETLQSNSYGGASGSGGGGIEIDPTKKLMSILSSLESRVALLESYPHLPPIATGHKWDAAVIELGRVVWRNIAKLIFKVSPEATDHFVFSLKSPTAEGLDTDYATVVEEDDDGNPVWYGQFDYMRWRE